MSTTSDLTNLQAVQYSLDHPGVFLALTGDKITLVDKTGLDTSKVVSTTAWFVERMPDGASALDDKGIKISSPLQLHVKGSTSDADKVSKMVTDLLEINDQYRHVSTKGEYEAYINLRNRQTTNKHFPWFKEEFLSDPKITYDQLPLILVSETANIVPPQDKLFKFLQTREKPLIFVSKPTDANEQTQIDEPLTFVLKRPETPSSDEAYTTGSSGSDSPTTTKEAFAMPKNFADACDAEAEELPDEAEPLSDWDIVESDDLLLPSNTKAQATAVDSKKSLELNPYLFADYKQPPLTNLVSVLSSEDARSNYLSWDSTGSRFTLSPINNTNKSSLTFLQLEAKFLSPKGLYVEKTKAQEIQAQIKSDKFNHTALKALKEHLISNDLKISSKPSDVRI